MTTFKKTKFYLTDNEIAYINMSLKAALDSYKFLKGFSAIKSYEEIILEKLIKKFDK